jgi:carboxypeptidase C (cathepsin A)
MSRSSCVLSVLLLFTFFPAGNPCLGQESADKPAAPAAQEKSSSKPEADPLPVVTHHEIHARGQLIKYTATVGMMPLKNEKGETEARMFYMAYTLDQPGSDRSKRPLTFTFNGGPGSASAWLHLGAIGPRRVKMQNEGFMPAPPYQLVDNDSTWLPQTDLVFIDPIGTGFSKALKPENLKKFLGLQGDTAAVAEFIRLYLSRNERWSSPLFLAGESYGTTRASALSGYLIQREGIALNGVILLSTVLNFETLEFVPGNDLPFELFLPTYTATAWYHHKLDSSLGDLKSALHQSEEFARTTYADALSKGNRLTPDERAKAVDGLAHLTGLSRQYIDQSDLRVDEPHFTKELLRGERLNVGRLDSRFTGIEDPLIGAISSSDPTETSIRAPFASSFNQYIRAELNWKTDDKYYLLGGGFKQGDWDWGSAGGGYPNVSESLRSAFAENRYMKLFVASGYYDLATPYYATQYTLAHLGLEPQEMKNVSTGYYEAGHMMYLQDKSLTKLHDDVSIFIAGALQQ